MTIYYQFVPEDYLLLMRWTGIFSLSQYNRFLKEIRKNYHWQHLKRFFVNLRKLEIPPGSIVAKQALKIRKQNIFKLYRTACIVHNPSVLVNTHLYIADINSSHYKYFSTTKSAINHLGLNHMSCKIEDLLGRLSNNF